MTVKSRYAVLERAIAATTGLSSQHKPFRILEIGVHHADRAVAMINFASQLGRTHIDYFGFDLFSSWTPTVNKAEIGKAAPPMSAADVVTKLTDKTKVKSISLKEGDSKITLPAEVKSLPRMNVIFLDGGHSLETVKSDLLTVLPALAQGGILVLDDYYEDLPDAGCSSVLDLFPEGWHWAVAKERDVFSGVGAIRMVVAGVDEAKVRKVAAVNDTKRHAGLYAGHAAANGDNNSDVQAVELPDDNVPVSVEVDTDSDADSGGRWVAGLDGAGNVGVGAAGEEKPADNPPVPEERKEPDPVVEQGPVPGDGPGAEVCGGSEFGSEVSSTVAGGDSGSSGE